MLKLFIGILFSINTTAMAATCDCDAPPECGRRPASCYTQVTESQEVFSRLPPPETMCYWNCTDAGYSHNACIKACYPKKHPKNPGINPY